MSFVLSALGLGRRMKAQRFTETVEFFTVELGEEEDVETLIASNIPAQVKSSSSVVSDKDLAGQALEVTQREVHVPVGSVLVGPSVMVRVTASTADDDLVGRVYRTRMRPGGGQVTAWRYPVEEVS